MWDRISFTITIVVVIIISIIYRCRCQYIIISITTTIATITMTNPLISSLPTSFVVFSVMCWRNHYGSLSIENVFLSTSESRHRSAAALFPGSNDNDAIKNEVETQYWRYRKSGLLSRLTAEIVFVRISGGESYQKWIKWDGNLRFVHCTDHRHLRVLWQSKRLGVRAEMCENPEIM